MTHHAPINAAEPFIPAQGASGAASRLPAIIDQLPPDGVHPAQTQFTRARQAAFLHRLADSGEVRVAAGNANVSHQTVYRMRRSCATFRLGWDAALIIARERAEDMLASRALHGVEEEVYYHGEVVAKRRRYDSRLLLAHLARLDRMAEREDVAALAGAFDDVIAAFEAADEGEVPVLPEVGGAGDFGDVGEGPEHSSGACNMRSMSRPASAPETAEESGEEAGEEGADWDDDGEGDWGKGDWGEGDWEEGVLAMETRLCAMEAARPQDAPTLRAYADTLDRGDGEGVDMGALEAAQLDAFEAGEEAWWEAVPRTAAGAD